MTNMPEVTFTWELPHWETATRPINGFKDAIIAVAWRLTATNGEASQTVFGRVALPPPPAGSVTFVSKADLVADPARCRATVIEWIKPIMGYDAYVAKLTEQLNADYAAAPTSIVEPLPQG